MGLLCYVLNKIFPTTEEYQEFKRCLDLNPKQFHKGTINIEQNLIHVQTNAQKGRFILQKYIICGEIYKLLGILCENNAANAATLAHYFPILSGHIGKGFFICEALKKCFYANNELLSNLHKVRLDQIESEN